MKSWLTIILFVTTIHLFAGWEAFSPLGIHANRISFYVDYNNNWAVCHQDGVYLFHLNTQTWTNHPAPGMMWARDAAWLNGDSILVALGNYSYSDGIYALNPETGEYSVLEWVDDPHFIVYDAIYSNYFCGGHSGLMYSENGIDWTSIDYFLNKNIVDLAVYGNYCVATEIDNLYVVYVSNDGGENWIEAPGAPMILDLEFDLDGKLYGIFPDESWSSGLWSSNDYGLTWNVEFWATGMNCVGTDYMNDVLVGFGESPQPPHEGLARWDSTGQQLIFLNDGLPNPIINQVTYNPAMSAPAIFCCTDTGVFVNHDYVGIQVPVLPEYIIKAWPNPATDILKIETGIFEKAEIRIYSIGGRLVDILDLPENAGRIEYPCSDLEPGAYVLQLRSGHREGCFKWLKR